jgi:hypothetical protein
MAKHINNGSFMPSLVFLSGGGDLSPAAPGGEKFNKLVMDHQFIKLFRVCINARIG